MSKTPRDFRGIAFVPGQQIAYARRGSGGKIFLQLAKIEEVNSILRIPTTTLEETRDGGTGQFYSLQVLKSDGKSQTLTRFDAIAVLAEER